MKLNSIILFGSKASENHTVWNDYDISILSNDFTKFNKWDRMEPVLSKWHRECVFKPVCYTSKKLGNSNYTRTNEIMN